MRYFRFILLLFRRVVLCVMLLYWVAFIGYSVAKFIQGGSERVVAYYWYTLCENRLDPCQWSWRVFLTVQLSYLAITLPLCFFEWRSMRKRRKKELGRG